MRGEVLEQFYDVVLRKIEENTRSGSESENVDYTDKLDTIITAIETNTLALNDLIDLLTPDDGGNGGVEG